MQTFQPPIMDVGDDTIPELQPIFTFLNSHSNKLYQEGYFLKLDDQNTRTFACLRRRIPPLSRIRSLTFMQMAVRILTGHGPSALPSLWAPCCHYGMLQN